jgi:hypothetical protein
MLHHFMCYSVGFCTPSRDFLLIVSLLVMRPAPQMSSLSKMLDDIPAGQDIEDLRTANNSLLKVSYFRRNSTFTFAHSGADSATKIALFSMLHSHIHSHLRHSYAYLTLNRNLSGNSKRGGRIQ